MISLHFLQIKSYKIIPRVKNLKIISLFTPYKFQELNLSRKYDSRNFLCSNGYDCYQWRGVL